MMNDDNICLSDDAPIEQVMATLPEDVKTIIAQYSGWNDNATFENMQFLTGAGDVVHFDAERSVATALIRRFKMLLHDRYSDWPVSGPAGGRFIVEVTNRRVDHVHMHGSQAQIHRHMSQL